MWLNENTNIFINVIIKSYEKIENEESFNLEK